MPTENGAVGAVRLKPSTRSSIRQSLNLASVGKALSDVINKEGRDGDKGAKKSKESSSRRLSGMNIMQGSATSRASLDPKPRTSIDAKPPTRRAVTPEASKTMNRHTRRSSGLPKPATTSSDESGLANATSPTQAIGITRSASLRPRNNASLSSLPKYRPKSAVIEPLKKPPSPPKTGTRRRLSSSDDEKEDKKGKGKLEMVQSSAEKKARTFSPLPHRGALKVNLSAAINVTPSTPTKGKSSVSSPLKHSSPRTSPKTSPSRPTKAAKTMTVTSPSQFTIPRPPSSASSTGSPCSPKTPTSVKSLFRSREKGQGPSPFRPSSRTPAESPPAKRTLKATSNLTPTRCSRAAAATSPIVEEDSEDDVEMLLAPSASLAAPTPAMPRVPSSRLRHKYPPKTPIPSTSNLPTRGNLSYLSPVPQETDNSPSLRPPPSSTGENRPRGSILTWEQLAMENSRTLGDDEIDKMLADVPPPFHSAPVSPTPHSALLSVAESPCLSAFNSPGGYGSISQVLLPDVTPSPAHPKQRLENEPPEMPAVEAAIVTLLRLQLVSAESTAKERLSRLQSMEEELHLLKEARVREAEDLASKVSYVEEQLHDNLEARERKDVEQASYAASLEDQLRHERGRREEIVAEAVAGAQEAARACQEITLKAERQRWEIGCLARKVAATWSSVHDLADSELDFVRTSREMLSVLLAGLDQGYRKGYSFAG